MDISFGIVRGFLPSVEQKSTPLSLLVRVLRG
jgi:hypothetical protein